MQCTFTKRGGSGKRRSRQKVGKAESESKERQEENEKEESRSAALNVGRTQLAFRANFGRLSYCVQEISLACKLMIMIHGSV